MAAILGTDSGKNLELEGKAILPTLPLLEMVQTMPELDPGTDYSLVTGRTSLSLGPLTIPVDVTIEIPEGANWVIL
jgi:hypothetical protein